MILNKWLKEAGITRQEFADISGIGLSTTYWATPPKWAYEYLKLKSKHRRLEAVEFAIRDLLE